MVQNEIDLFSIVNDELVINKLEARIFPALNKIVTRDKGGKIKGDSDGRKKYVAFEELKYMYLVYSPYSIYRGLEITIRQERALSIVELYENWKEDEEFKAATEEYVNSFFASPIYFTYINTSTAVYDIGVDIQLFNNRKALLRKRLDLLNDIVTNIKSSEEEIQRAEATIITVTNSLMDLSERILKISERLPQNFESLERLYKKFQEEKGEEGKIYGGGVLGNREDN